MTIKEMEKAAQDALVAAGVVSQEHVRDISYVDIPCLAALRPEQKWVDAECRVLVFSDRVQRFQRSYPLNFTTGQLVGVPIAYSSVAEMLQAVRKLMDVNRAACWSAGAAAPLGPVKTDEAEPPSKLTRRTRLLADAAYVFLVKEGIYLSEAQVLELREELYGTLMIPL